MTTIIAVWVGGEYALLLTEVEQGTHYCLLSVAYKGMDYERHYSNLEDAMRESEKLAESWGSKRWALATPAEVGATT